MASMLPSFPPSFGFVISSRTASSFKRQANAAAMQGIGTYQVVEQELPFPRAPNLQVSLNNHLRLGSGVVPREEEAEL